MKSPRLKQLKINKKIRLKEVYKIKKEINDIVEDCLIDIRPYIIKDIMVYLKKKGIIYAKKSKKNTTKKKR